MTNDLPTRVTDFNYILITTFEEILEMTGIAVLVYALANELVPEFNQVFSKRLVESIPSERAWPENLRGRLKAEISGAK